MLEADLDHRGCSVCVMAALVQDMPRTENTWGFVGTCKTMEAVETVSLLKTCTDTEYPSAKQAQNVDPFNCHHPVLPTRQLSIGSIDILLVKVAK